MVLGEKLWEGKGKSAGPGFIKYVGMEGVASIYSWTAQLKGMGRAKGTDVNLNATGKSMMPPKGVGKAKTQGMFMTATGDMGVFKGFDLSKMAGTKPIAVGLYSFMTMSEKLGWMNDLIAVVTFEAVDPMWMELNITVHEWK
jgi:hypothetical protein